MNLKFRLTNLRRRTLMLIAVVALTAAMLPTAAFASSYPYQGRAWDPKEHSFPQQRDDHRPAKQEKKYRPQQEQKHQPQYDSCNVTHKVKRGENLSKIAKWYGVSVYQLQKANGIKNPNRVYAGQIICIPG